MERMERIERFERLKDCFLIIVGKVKFANHAAKWRNDHFNLPKVLLAKEFK